MRPTTFLHFCLLLCLCCEPLTAEQRGKEELVKAAPRVAVLDFEFQGISEAEAEQFAAAISNSAGDIKGYDFVSRESIKASPSELQLSPEETKDRRLRLVEYGKTISAHQIVTGRLVKEQGPYTVDMDLIDVYGGKVVNGVSKDYMSMSDLCGDVENLLRHLLAPPIQLLYYRDTSYSAYSFGDQSYSDTHLLISALEQKGDLTEEMKKEIFNFRTRYGFGAFLHVIGIVMTIPGLLLLGVLTEPGAIHDNAQTVPIVIGVAGGSVFLGIALTAIGINMKAPPSKVFELYNRQRTGEIVSPGAHE